MLASQEKERMVVCVTANPILWCRCQQTQNGPDSVLRLISAYSIKFLVLRSTVDFLSLSVRAEVISSSDSLLSAIFLRS
jgi:hypothetical protein